MFREQFIMTPKIKEDVVALAEFIALMYGQYFLQSALAISAPRLDRDLWVNVHAYRVCIQLKYTELKE